MQHMSPPVAPGSNLADVKSVLTNTKRLPIPSLC